jgi:hypothetical protein
VEAFSETVVNDDPVEAAKMGEESNATIPTPDEPSTMELAYHVTGERRKELVKAISQITGLPAMYQKAPTFAFSIGDYTMDKAGTLTGVYDDALVGALAKQGFVAE